MWGGTIPPHPSTLQRVEGRRRLEPGVDEVPSMQVKALREATPQKSSFAIFKRGPPLVWKGKISGIVSS